MLPPEPLSQAPRYPVTAGTGLLALAVTVPSFLGIFDIEPLAMDVRAFHAGEPWRLLTSALPHGSVLHLAFNLFWLWMFGAYIEKTFGPLRTAALFVFCAVGSAAAEYAVFRGGIGLSGIGYGLFAFLWVLARRDPRHAEAMDPSTVRLFVGWFFLCIVLTVMRILPIANVAHGMGAVLGALAGFAAVSSPLGRGAAVTACAGALAITLGAATVARPVVNFSSERGADGAYYGYRALVDQRNADAIPLLEEAVRMKPGEADWWFNLGIAYQLTRAPERSQEAFARAQSLAPGNPRYTIPRIDAAVATPASTTETISDAPSDAPATPDMP